MMSKHVLVGAIALLMGSDLPMPIVPLRPVAAWPAGPLETRLAFKTPIDPKLLPELVGATIRFVEPPSVPDAREGTLNIAATRLADANRTLILLTDPHPRVARYRFASRHFQLEYDLSGVEGSWTNLENELVWSGWFPSLALGAELVTLAENSVEHQRGLRALENPGVLSLRTLIELPKGKNIVQLSASRPFEATLGSESATAKNQEGTHVARLMVESAGESVDLAMIVKTGPGPKALSILATIEGADSGGINLPLNAKRLSLPWAPTPPVATSNEPDGIKLDGGDPKRGEEIFFGNEAKCSTCHKVNSKGNEVGPDLSEIGTHDKAWIHRNIVAPSASIHPDYVSYTVARKSGQVAMGVVKSAGAVNLKVLDTSAGTTIVPRDDVEELRPSASSIMPVGLLGAIGDDRTRDLLAYLATLGHKK